MGTLDKFMDLMRINDPEIEEEYENEEDYEEYEEEEVEEVEEKRSFFSFGRKKEAPAVVEEEEEIEEEPAYTPQPTRGPSYRPAPTRNKVVSMNGTGIEVIVVRPIDFTDCKIIADYLGEGKTVMINMEDIKNPAAQRTIDFIGGAVYAYNGTLTAASPKMFIAAPGEVIVDGDLCDDIMNENIVAPQISE